MIRAHNNSKVCIIPVKRINPDEKLNNIINAFCVSEFEAGRHVTRLQILHGTMVDAKETIKFSATPNKTVVVGSDHAGFALKQAVKEHLESKGYKIIDVGTYSLDSTHYSLFGVAMGAHIHEASFAIGFCYTGMGMANSLNKFKGLRACVCMTPENAKVAREVYGCNTLVMGSKFSNKEQALKTVDVYLETKANDNPIYKCLDQFGFNFDKNKFKELTMEKGIIVPKELQ
ncbi:MAG: RpiB/LacA/LacB family sugar-phosphate isomerase [Mycoplasmoidaceae bacterium]|nr:RpiB/LacA/LacB family sugar-phosphate isomerase [Mycoplasmoidaceae bacterium]